MSARTLQVLHVLALAAACFIVFANAYGHAYNLDSGHMLVENPAIRSLKNIPKFFTDPGTLTSLRANVDYRPVLTVSFALNYWMGGYEMWWWHLTQIVLHLFCVVGLYALCLRILRRSEPTVVGNRAAWIAFAAAAVFAVHPTSAGVVDYEGARSSLLTAAFLLPALLVYSRAEDDKTYGRTAWGTALLVGLALFTKVEAIACLAVLFLYDCWETARRRKHVSGFLKDVLYTINLTTLKRLWPTLVIAAVYVVVRIVVMAEYPFSDSSRRPDVSRLDYVQTQLVACAYYVRHWFAPVGLVADHGSYPVFRSIWNPAVLLALGAWSFFGSWLLAQWRSRPQLLFLALSALALISPTSSIVPLAEMVNEHRPYLPLAVLSLVWMTLAGIAIADSIAVQRFRALGYGLAFAVILAGLGGMTLERNKVFLSPEAYWKDVIDKAPSARAYVNYGLAKMHAGDNETALEYFLKALELGPNWHITHINLGVVYDELGQPDKALEHFNKAVEFDTYSWTALTWRGRHFVKRGWYDKARVDFEASAKMSLDRFGNNKGLAAAWAGLGNALLCMKYTEMCLDIDPRKTEGEIVDIITPYFVDPNVENGRHQLEEGLDYLELLNARLPERWWYYCNKATLARRLGLEEQANAWQKKCDELKATPAPQ